MLLVFLNKIFKCTPLKFITIFIYFEHLSAKSIYYKITKSFSTQIYFYSYYQCEYNCNKIKQILNLYSLFNYIGQTSRHLETRIKEHVPKCFKEYIKNQPKKTGNATSMR